MQRRHTLAWMAAELAVPLATGLTASAVAGSAQAQNFPTRPVRIIVGYTPGGAVDLIARALAQQLQLSLGQPVIVENKPGAGTNIANRALIDSPSDGHTLMLAANALAANVSLYQPPPYDLARDVVPIALVGRVPVVLAVAATSEHASLARFMAAARAAGGAPITVASPGNGSTPHLALALFERAAGLHLTHVPYKGGTQAITDLLGGHVQAVAVNALEVQPHVKAGKLRVLAVMTAQRSGLFADVPTVAESGLPGFEASVWYGLIAPAGLHAGFRARLHAAVQHALASDDLKQRLSSAGGEVLPGLPEAFVALLASERLRYETLIRDARIKPD